MGDLSPFGKACVLDPEKVFVPYVEIENNFLPKRKLVVGNPVVTTSPPFLVGLVQKIKTVKQGRGKKAKQVTKVWIDDANETRNRIRNISCCVRPPVKNEYIRHAQTKQWYQCISGEQTMMELRVVLMSPPATTASNAPAASPAGANAPAAAPAADSDTPVGSDVANPGATAPAPDANANTNDLNLVSDERDLRLVSTNDAPAPPARAPAPVAPLATNHTRSRRATLRRPQRATDTYVYVCIHTILSVYTHIISYTFTCVFVCIHTILRVYTHIISCYTCVCIHAILHVYIMRRYMHLCMYTQNSMLPIPFFYACMP